MIVTIRVNEDGITLGIGFGTDMVSLDGFFDVCNDVNLGGFLLGDLVVSTDVKFLGSDEVNKLALSDGKVLVTIIVIYMKLNLGLILGGI